MRPGLLLLLGMAQISSPQSTPDAAASWPAPPGLGAPRGALPGCGRYMLAHGRAMPGGEVRHLGTIELSCDPGYELDGPGEATVQCLLGGRFTPGKTCRPISCGKLAVPGGVADPPTAVAYPHVARLTCSRGFRLSTVAGAAERRCLSSGKFSEGARCEPAERWTAANVQHARADLLEELLVTGQGFIAGAFYECHFTLASRSDTCTRISTQVVLFLPVIVSSRGACRVTDVLCACAKQLRRRLLRRQAPCDAWHPPQASLGAAMS